MEFEEVEHCASMLDQPWKYASICGQILSQASEGGSFERAHLSVHDLNRKFL